MFEVYKALSGKMRSIHLVGYLFAAIYMFCIDFVSDYRVLTIILILMTMTVLCCLVLFYGKINIIDSCITVFGFYYVAILLSSLYLVRCFDYGVYFTWIIFIAAWGSDTGAYAAGKLLGKHKLTAKLSPSKTIEGAVGGVVAAIALSFVYGLLVSKIFDIEDITIISFCVIAGASGAVFAIIGDLVASAIKRFNGIKDFGNIIPGHGGVLDRFDSVLFTAPAVYIVLLILEK